TRICRALKLSESEPSSFAEPVMPRKFEGTRPVRKSSQPPWVEEAAAESAETLEFSPGEVSAPSAMPTETAMSEVIANHSRVFQARRAALVTLRRFAIEVTIARKISGGTSAFSRVTKIDPMVDSVVVSQFAPSGLASVGVTGPMFAATSPRITPRTRPMRTCQPKGMRTIARSGLRVRRSVAGGVVDVLTSDDATPGLPPRSTKLLCGHISEPWGLWGGPKAGCGAVTWAGAPAARVAVHCGSVVQACSLGLQGRAPSSGLRRSRSVAWSASFGRRAGGIPTDRRTPADLWF